MAADHKSGVVELKEPNASEVQIHTPNQTAPTSNDELPLAKAIRQYPKVVACTFGVMTAILFVGYDTVIVGTVTALPWFQRDFGTPSLGSEKHWLLPATWVSLWSALGPVGAVLGGVCAGWSQDQIGRKRSLTAGSVVAVIAVAIMYCSNLSDNVGARRGVFLFSKILQGGSVGIMLATGQTYVSEIVPVSLRGPTMALFPTFILLGQLAGAAVIFGLSRENSPRSYLLSFASQWPFAGLTFIVSFLIPESPAWLLHKNRWDDALRAQRRLHTAKVDIPHSLELMKELVEQERKQAAETSYLECFRGTDRRRTWIVILASLIPLLFGLPLLANASYYMQQVGMKASTSLIFLIIGIALGAIANGVGVWVLSKVGRRTLILLSMSITTVLWASMGVSGIWHGHPTIWYTAIIMMLIVMACGVGAWPASYTVVVETSSLRLRARAQGIGVLTSQLANVVFQLVLPYIYNHDAGNLRSKTGFFYAGVCGIGTIFCWFLVPEMKDRSAKEIDHMFEMGLPTRSFKQHTNSAAMVE